MDTNQLRKRITFFLCFFIFALSVSGITAIPLRWEIDILNNLVGQGTWMQFVWPAMARWISFVHEGITNSFTPYPFLPYGTDWLAFAHIVIAIAFIGVLRDPIRKVLI